MEQNQQLLEQIQQKFLLKQMPAKEYSPLVLAYIGDGIYDMIVRTIFVSYGNTQVDKLNKQASKCLPCLFTGRDCICNCTAFDRGRDICLPQRP